jgi:hypothetical protein
MSRTRRGPLTKTLHSLKKLLGWIGQRVSIAPRASYGICILPTCPIICRIYSNLRILSFDGQLSRLGNSIIRVLRIIVRAVSVSNDKFRSVKVLSFCASSRSLRHREEVLLQRLRRIYSFVLSLGITDLLYPVIKFFLTSLCFGASGKVFSSHCTKPKVNTEISTKLLTAKMMISFPFLVIRYEQLRPDHFKPQDGHVTWGVTMVLALLTGKDNKLHVEPGYAPLIN